MPPDNPTAENCLPSPSSLFEAGSASLRNLGLPSGSHPALTARASSHLLPWPLLPSYSAVTQNLELFIQPDGKTVKKVSMQEIIGEKGGTPGLQIPLR